MEVDDSFKQTELRRLFSLSGVNWSGPRGLENASFADTTLPRLLIGPGLPPFASVRVANCSFRNCRIQGEMRIAPGVELESVVFDNVSAPDGMLINTPTILRNVTVNGSVKKRGLWVKPSSAPMDADTKERYREWTDRAAGDRRTMLDFSGLDAPDTEVVGLPLSQLRWNPAWHLPMLREWKDSEAWRRLDFPAMSPLWVRMRRLERFDAAAGVFSLPSDTKKPSLFLEQVHQLIDAGIVLPSPLSS